MKETELEKQARHAFMDIYPQLNPSGESAINFTQGYIAAATKYRKQQRQVIADTWDAAALLYEWRESFVWSRKRNSYKQSIPFRDKMRTTINYFDL